MTIPIGSKYFAVCDECGATTFELQEPHSPPMCKMPGCLKEIPTGWKPIDDFGKQPKQEAMAL